MEIIERFKIRWGGNEKGWSLWRGVAKADEVRCLSLSFARSNVKRSPLKERKRFVYQKRNR